MENINFAELAREHREEIIDKMIEMTVENCGYQRDLYLYPDGELYVFDNVGGNSWLNDEHEVVWSYTGEEFVNEDGEEMDGDEIRQVCHENYDQFRTNFEAAVEQIELREEQRREQSEW